MTEQEQEVLQHGEEKETIPRDGVSRVQEALAQVCESLFVSIGSLQRDAPPRSLQDEDIWNTPGGDVKPSEKDTIEETAVSMGTEIQKALEELKSSIDALPDTLMVTKTMHDTTSVEVCALVEAVQKNVELEKELVEVLKNAEEHTQRMQGIHAAIVDSLLFRKGAKGCL